MGLRKMSAYKGRRETGDPEGLLWGRNWMKTVLRAKESFEKEVANSIKFYRAIEKNKDALNEKWLWQLR